MKRRQPKRHRFSAEEKILHESILAARQVQKFLWGFADGAWSVEEWRRMLRKRVSKLDEVSQSNPHASVEFKKRLLQTAACSIALLAIIEKRGVPWKGKGKLPSNLPKYATPITNQRAKEITMEAPGMTAKRKVAAFIGARAIIRDRFREDTSLKEAYRSNIACMLYDASAGADHHLNLRSMDCCNIIANRILDSFFD